MSNKQETQKRIDQIRVFGKRVLVQQLNLIKENKILTTGKSKEINWDMEFSIAKHSETHPEACKHLNIGDVVIPSKYVEFNNLMTIEASEKRTVTVMFIAVDDLVGADSGPNLEERRAKAKEEAKKNAIVTTKSPIIT